MTELEEGDTIRIKKEVEFRGRPGDYHTLRRGARGKIVQSGREGELITFITSGGKRFSTFNHDNLEKVPRLEQKMDEIDNMSALARLKLFIKARLGEIRQCLR